MSTIRKIEVYLPPNHERTLQKDGAVEIHSGPYLDVQEKAFLIIGGKAWTEEEHDAEFQRRAKAYADDLLSAHLSPGKIVEREDEGDEALYEWIRRAIEAVNAKHGIKL